MNEKVLSGKCATYYVCAHVCVCVQFSPRRCFSIQSRCAFGSIVIRLDLSAPLLPVSYLPFDVWEVFHLLSVWVNIPAATHTHTHTRTCTYKNTPARTHTDVRWEGGIGRVKGAITKEQEGSEVQVNTCSVSKRRAQS